MAIWATTCNCFVTFASVESIACASLCMCQAFSPLLWRRTIRYDYACVRPFHGYYGGVQSDMIMHVSGLFMVTMEAYNQI